MTKVVVGLVAAGAVLAAGLVVGVSLATRCGEPLVVRAGGTYHGCYESRDPHVPAVRIATTEPVVLDDVTVRHVGVGVYGRAVPADLTVTDSTFLAEAPGRPVPQQAVYLYAPTAFVFEHNAVRDGHGVEVNGGNMTTRPFRVRFNDGVDVGRYGTADPVQFLMADKVRAPGGRVEWNRVVDHHGRSVTEDVIDLYQTNGARSDPIQVAHNLVDGAYPAGGDGASYTGGGIDAGDAGHSSWIEVHDNTVVSYTNVGVQIPGGHDIHLVDNTVVDDGLADDGARVSSRFGQGVSVYDPYGLGTSHVSASGNRVGHRRWKDHRWERVGYFLPQCDPAPSCRDNSAALPATSAAERRAVDAWDAARERAGVSPGPR